MYMELYKYFSLVPPPIIWCQVLSKVLKVTLPWQSACLLQAPLLSCWQRHASLQRIDAINFPRKVKWHCTAEDLKLRIVKWSDGILLTFWSFFIEKLKLPSTSALFCNQTDPFLWHHLLCRKFTHWTQQPLWLGQIRGEPSPRKNAMYR